MADDPTATPDPVAPPAPKPAVPAPKPEPAPVPPDIQDKVQKNAAYLARNPEVLDGVLTELGRATSAEANQRVDHLERELMVRDAISDHGLTRADADFISGNTAEEINASAAALKARIGTPPANGEVPDAPPEPQPAPAPAPDVVPALPENRGSKSSIEQSEAEFIEIFNKTDMSKFTE